MKRCRQPGCERIARPTFTHCDEHTRELVFAAWRPERVDEPSEGIGAIPPVLTPSLVPAAA